MRSNLVNIIIAALVVLIIAIPLFSAFTFILLQLFPPVDDERPVMPTIQVVAGIFLTFISSVFLYIRIMKFLRQMDRKE